MCYTDIRMDSGVSKYATLVLKEKRASSGGIVLLDEECLLETGDGGYKCISILELDDITHKEMKEEVETTHLERLQFA